MTDTRQFIVRFDRRHDAAAIARIEQQPSMSEYIRELVRRDTSDENARLRQQLADVTESMGRVEERCAKLRELVRHLYVCRSYTAINGGDDMPCEECEYDNDKWLCDFEERMRELGIESKE